MSAALYERPENPEACAVRSHLVLSLRLEPFIIIHQRSAAYPVYVGRDLLGRVGTLVHPRGRVFVITSPTLRARFGDMVAASFHPAADVITVSLTTVEFKAAAGGTQLVLTEQGAFLDGREEPAWRENGTADQLKALASVLEGTAPEHQ